MEKDRISSDEELILRYRDGEEGIIDHIMEKYKNLVRKKAGSMFILGGDRDDLIQEGMIGLFKAVRDYDMGRDVSFYPFADLCISRQMYTAVQASTRQKHFPLNTYISLYSHAGKDTGEVQEGESLLNAFQGGRGQNPEEMFLEQERIEWLETALAEELSPLEKQVLDLHITGMTYTEIAKVLGRDEKSTDNALQRIKHKLRKILEEKNEK
ncbi:MAG: RNA polymerase sporulation sigma factor SigH [Lachnospiraceae bacterium]|nr:RNA polymerase sporulation sigma factor SigH [Lachnospiraceae bacterium]